MGTVPLVGLPLQTHMQRAQPFPHCLHPSRRLLQTAHEPGPKKVTSTYVSSFPNQSVSRLFESVVKYFDAFLSLIPLSFVLGFYVSYVASRWWQQFLAIPWPDKLFHTVACYIPGKALDTNCKFFSWQLSFIKFTFNQQTKIFVVEDFDPRL